MADIQGFRQRLDIATDLVGTRGSSGVEVPHVFQSNWNPSKQMAETPAAGQDAQDRTPGRVDSELTFQCYLDLQERPHAALLFEGILLGRVIDVWLYPDRRNLSTFFHDEMRVGEGSETLPNADVESVNFTLQSATGKEFGIDNTV